MLISDLGESSWGQEHVRAKREERDLLMMFRCHLGPVAYALYRVEVPYLSPAHEFRHCLKKTRRVEFRPILELPSSVYPENMSCVQLHSKLYFLGGHFDSDQYGIAKDPAFDIYVLDPTKININDASNNHALLLRKNVAGRLIGAKPFPYAFAAIDKIFVIDNFGQGYTRPYGESYFEVFDPKKKSGCIEIPNPPVSFVISGHAVVEEKLFISGFGHVICFDTKMNQWVQDFIQDFSYGHMFFGEAQLIGDIMYAISGDNFRTPAAYKLSSKRLQYNLRECAAMNSESPFGEHATDLFDDLVLLSPSLEDVHKLVSYDWLGTSFFHVGDGVFCYIRSGMFPRDSRPKHLVVILAFFEPHAKAFTETVYGEDCTSFSGHFLHSARLKFNGFGPRGFGSLISCFSIPKEIKNADGGQDKLQVPGKAMIESQKSTKDVKSRWQ